MRETKNPLVTENNRFSQVFSLKGTVNADPLALGDSIRAPALCKNSAVQLFKYFILGTLEYQNILLKMYASNTIEVHG